MTAGKRAVDVAGAAAGLLLLLPLMAVVAAAIRLVDGAPVLFRQDRIGPHGPFPLLKFRTMRAVPGPSVTALSDQRITALGRRLRRWKVDELPQLLNVLRGEMTLVGPRPEVPRFVRDYTPSQQAILAYRPGLTDPASLAFRDEDRLLASAPDPEQFYRTAILPAKLAMSLAYARRATLVSDLGVLAATARALLSPRPSTASRARPLPVPATQRKEHTDALSL